MILVQNKYKKHPLRCSEDPNNLRFELINIVHSGDKGLTQVI